MIKIYKLSDPRTNQTHYIGQTNGSLIDRLAEHIGEVTTRSGSATHFTKEKREWIRTLLSLGLCPLIETLDIVPKELRFKKELEWIVLYRLEKALLYQTSMKNVTHKFIEDLPLKTNHRLQQEYNINKKCCAFLRQMFCGTRLGGISVKQSGRPYKNSLKIFDEIKSVVDWIRDERCKIGQKALLSRIKKGWSPEKALITPTKYNRYKDK